MSERSLAILLTANCILRCRYCCQRRKEVRRLAWPLLKANVEALLPRAGDVHVSFTGGEPLLEFGDIVRLVACVEERVRPPRTLRWGLITNGLLLDDETAAFLDSKGFEVVLSFDGLPSAQALRGRGTFRRLDRTLDRLHAHHPALFDRIEINAIVTPATVGHLHASVRYFLDKHAPTVTVFPAIGQPGWSVNRIAELEEEFGRVFRACVRHYHRTRDIPLTLFRKVRSNRRPERARTRWICEAVSGTRFALDVDGQAYGCVLATRSYHVSEPDVLRPALDALSLGRPTDQEFPARVRRMKTLARACGAFQHADQRYSSYGRCAQCEYLRRCVPCPLAPAAEREWDNVRRVPDFICAFNRVSLACRDRFPAQPSAVETLTGRVPGTK